MNADETPHQFQADLIRHDPAVVVLHQRLVAGSHNCRLEQLYELIYTALKTSLRYKLDARTFCNLARLCGFQAETLLTTYDRLIKADGPIYAVIQDPEPRFVVIQSGDAAGISVLDPVRGVDDLERAYFEAGWSGAVMRLVPHHHQEHRFNAAMASLDRAFASTLHYLERRYHTAFVEKGGHGFIYRGYQGTSPVCIKIIPGFYNDRRYLVSFLNEFEIHRRLESEHHPGIIQARWMDLDHRYLVMEAAEESLADQDLPVPLETALIWFTQVVDAVLFLHERGFIHRDIKPGNLLLFAGGRIKLADFGLALRLKQGQRYFQPDRQGTPLYMAPEQKKGQPLSPAGDIYALGLILLELLVGKASRADRFRHSPTLAMRRLSLPHRVSRLIRECLAKDPERRPSALALKNSVLALSAKPRLRSLIASVPDSRLPKASLGAVSPGSLVPSLSPDLVTGSRSSTSHSLPLEGFHGDHPVSK